MRLLVPFFVCLTAVFSVCADLCIDVYVLCVSLPAGNTCSTSLLAGPGTMGTQQPFVYRTIRLGSS